MWTGESPLLTGFDPSSYPLRVDFTVTPITNGGDNPVAKVTLPQRNYDPALLTSVLMTGTTALVRSTAERMETRGIDCPGLMIGSILNDADFTHISNEVSFTPDCPKPDPSVRQSEVLFKSSLFPASGKNGRGYRRANRQPSFGLQPGCISLHPGPLPKARYKDFRRGVNLLAAREPLIIEHNGNRIAFIGCNPVGPDYVWATDTSPGAAPCDFEAMQAKIKELSSNGVLIIATLQDEEESYEPMPLAQVRTASGTQLSMHSAVVVSHSQAHFPQGFSFRDNQSFITDFGNLFFDQMDYPVSSGTQREFYDKHFFYNERYINSQLLTRLLEDLASRAR